MCTCVHELTTSQPSIETAHMVEHRHTQTQSYSNQNVTFLSNACGQCVDSVYI